MSIDKFFDKDSEERVKHSIEESKDIIYNTFRVDIRYDIIASENIFKLYDRFNDRFPVDKEQHGLVLMYLTHKYYDYVSNIMIEKFNNKPKKLPKCTLNKLYQEDLDTYIDMFIQDDIGTKGADNLPKTSRPK